MRHFFEAVCVNFEDKMAPVSVPTISTQENDLFPALCRCFLDVSSRGLTGTLKVSVAEASGETEQNARDVLLLVHNGGVVDATISGEDSLLVEGLLSTGAFSDCELKRYQKRGKKKSTSLGTDLFNLRRIDDEDLLEIVQELLIHRACGVFAEGLVAFEFIEHSEDEVVEGFDNDLSEIFDLMFAGTDVFVEAMRRLGRWGDVESHYAGLLDIYYAAPSSVKYYNQPDEYECEVTVLKRMDGALDVSGVIKSTPLDPFIALQAIQALAYRGDVQRLNPIQMFQLGVEALDQKSFHQARRIFQRAMDLGLDDFDIQYKIAQTYEGLNDFDGAKKRYFEFAEKCLSQGRRGDAAQAYRHITQLDPLNIDLHKATIGVLIEDNRHEEALEQGLTAAEGFGEAGAPRSALEILILLRNHEFQEKRLISKIIQFAGRCGEKRLVEEELANNPACLDELLDLDQALDMYQRQFCDGNDSLEIRLKLIDLHLQKGNKPEILGHINGVLSSKFKTMITEKKVLVWLHETRQSLDPGNLASGRWMVNHYIEEDNANKALETLNALIRQAEKQNDSYCLVELHRSLLKLDPESVESHWELTRLYHTQEKHSRAIEELQKIAEMALEKSDLVTVKKVWSEAVRIAPFRRDALVALGKSLAESGHRKQALQCFCAVFQTDLAGGNLTEAREALDKVETIEPKSPDNAKRFGVALVNVGDLKEGVEYLLKAAATYLERKDFGSAGESVDLALEAIPECKEAERLKDELEQRQNPPAPPPTVAPSQKVTVPFGAKDDPLGEKEAFQPRAPMKKAPVSAITARLKNLKTSKPPEAIGGNFSGKQLVKTDLKSITDSLKRQRQAKPTTSGPAVSQPEADATPKETPSAPKVAAVTKKKGVGSAASRLKALAAGNDGQTSAPAQSQSSTVEVDSVSSDAPATAAVHTTPGTGADGDDSSEGLGPALVNEKLNAIKNSWGAVTKKASMGEAALRLAKLRAMKSKSKPDPTPEG